MFSTSLVQAANLRVAWEEHDKQGLVSQIVNINDIEQARDVIIALMMTAKMPTSVMRKVLSEGF